MTKSFKIFYSIIIFVLVIFQVKCTTEAYQNDSTPNVKINLNEHLNAQTEMIVLQLENMRLKIEEINLKTDEIKDKLNENSRRTLENELRINNMESTLENFQNNLNNFNLNISSLFINALLTQRTQPTYDKNLNCEGNCRPLHNLPSDCEHAMSSSLSSDGIYLLHIPKSGLKPFYAYCKRRENTIWTVIQRRKDGSVDFYRNWLDYKNGFGNLNSDFWLGLERLHQITKNYNHELYIELENEDGEARFANYKRFSIANETEKYTLIIGRYSGNAGNDLKYHNGKKFSTYDNCNDNHTPGKGDCAKSFEGAWWFDKCYQSHLNGPYISKEEGIEWVSFDKNLKYSEIMIRRL